MVGGVRKVVYDRSRFLVRFEGGAYRHIPGPVGYAELWIGIGGARLVGRFHDFPVNEADRVVARRASAVAAAGEAAFWTVLHGIDHSRERQEDALTLLGRAAARDRRDGWSTFLLAMLHLYRFGQSTVRYDQVTDAARAPSWSQRTTRSRVRCRSCGTGSAGTPAYPASPPPRLSASASSTVTRRCRRRDSPTSKRPSP